MDNYHAKCYADMKKIFEPLKTYKLKSQDNQTLAVSYSLNPNCIH